MKRRDFFDKCRKKLNAECQLLDVDAEANWSSAITLIKRVFAARRVLNAVASRMEETGNMSVTEMDGKSGDRLCAFLRAAAAITEYQSG